MIRHATAAGLVIAGTRRMACGCEGRACAYLTKENKKKYTICSSSSSMMMIRESEKLLWYLWSMEG